MSLRRLMLRLCVGSIALRDLSGDSLPAMDIDINIAGHAVDGGDETLGMEKLQPESLASTKSYCKT